MSKLSISAVLVMVVILATAAAPKEDRQPGALAPLRKGQFVTLKEDAGGYKIGHMSGVESGYKVVEVGADFVVVEDVAQVAETRIPVYSIKSVTITRVPKD